MLSAFLAPFLLHFGLILVLYLWLTVVRILAVERGEVRFVDFRSAGGDPPAAAPIARNLSNQFELPTFAWFAASLLVYLDAVGWADVLAAWVFLIGRVIHTAVQTLTANIRLRGAVFLINVAGVLWLAAHLAWRVFVMAG